VLGLLDFANDWLRKGGLLVLAAIVFAESGLLIGFFLPGDSLLFFAGFLASTAGGKVLPGGLPAVAVVAAAAAIAGDQVGYVFGRRVGPSLFTRPQGRLFNPANVAKSQAFFDKHGSKTIVLARFVPIVRTFTPVLAGVCGTDPFRIMKLFLRDLKAMGFTAQRGQQVVLTGGGAELPGLADFAQSALAKPTRIGKPPQMTGLPEAHATPGFATLAGLVLYAAADPVDIRSVGPSYQPTTKYTGAKLAGRVYRALKEYF